MSRRRSSQLSPSVGITQLQDVASLDEALELFNVKRDDNIETRELISIYQAVMDAMQQSRLSLTHNRQYEEARAQYERMRRIKSQFENRQKQADTKRQARERKSFVKARKKISTEWEGAWGRKMDELESTIEYKRSELAATHRSELQALDHTVSRMPVPRFRCSKMLLELKSSESHLAQLKQFDAARNMKQKIDKLEPSERARFAQAHKERIEGMYAALSRRQAREAQQLEERLQGLRLQRERDKAQARSRTAHRLDIHQHNMAHAHTLEKEKPIQTTFHPVTYERAHFKETSSTSRGTQLLSGVQGQKVDVPSLCALHDFNNEPADTVKFR